MNKLIYFIVIVLLIFWGVGFFALDLGIFIHILFVTALSILIYQIIREEKK